MQTLLLTNATRPLSVRSMSAQRLNKVLSVCFGVFLNKEASISQLRMFMLLLSVRPVPAGRVLV